MSEGRFADGALDDEWYPSEQLSRCQDLSAMNGGQYFALVPKEQSQPLKL